jgi:hypothetical protein
MDEEERDILERRKFTSKRNIDKVIFGAWEIKTWYITQSRIVLFHFAARMVFPCSLIGSWAVLG